MDDTDVLKYQLKLLSWNYSTRKLAPSSKVINEGIQRIIELENENAELKRRLESHNLELQAKGIDWVLACRELNLSEGEVHTMMDKCNQLRNQSKEAS